MTICKICGDEIHRRVDVPSAPRAEDDRPWLHYHGLDFEQRGIALHDAEPDDDS